MYSAKISTFTIYLNRDIVHLSEIHLSEHTSHLMYSSFIYQGIINSFQNEYFLLFTNGLIIFFKMHIAC